jgi:protease I
MLMEKWLLLLALLFLLLTGCASEQAIVKDKTHDANGLIGEARSANLTSGNRGGNMSTKNGKVLFIIAQANFRDEELSKPKAILEKAGYECVVASTDTALARGMLGGVVKPDIGVREVDIDDYDLFVVVGGSGAPDLIKHPEVLELLNSANNEGKKMAAICLGPMVLAKAGVLGGMNATVFKSRESLAALNEGGANYVEQSVVTDQGLVTANGPEAAEAFGNALLNLLKG